MLGTTKFDWQDPFLLDSQLSDVEHMMRDRAAAFAPKHLAPRINAAYLEEKTDPHVFREMGDAGLLGGTLDEKYGGTDAGYTSYGLPR